MHFEVSSAICFSLDQSKILSSGNGLKLINNNKLKFPLNHVNLHSECLQMKEDNRCNAIGAPTRTDKTEIKVNIRTSDICTPN